MSERKWLCPSCHQFAATTLLRVLTHIKQVHSLEAGFHVTCGLNQCPKTYDNFQSYRRHLYCKHSDELHPTTTNPDHEHIEQEDDHEFLEPAADEEENSSTVPVCDSTRQSALLLLKTTVKHKVSKTSLNGIIEDVSMFYEERTQSLQSQLGCLLHKRGVEFDSELVAVFQQPRLTTPFLELNTEYLRHQYYKSHFGFIVS